MVGVHGYDESPTPNTPDTWLLVVTNIADVDAGGFTLTKLYPNGTYRGGTTEEDIGPFDPTSETLDDEIAAALDFNELELFEVSSSTEGDDLHVEITMLRFGSSFDVVVKEHDLLDESEGDDFDVTVTRTSRSPYTQANVTFFTPINPDMVSTMKRSDWEDRVYGQPPWDTQPNPAAVKAGVEAAAEDNALEGDTPSIHGHDSVPGEPGRVGAGPPVRRVERGNL